MQRVVACLEFLAAFLPEVSEPEHPAKVPGRPPADWLLGEVHRRPQVRLPIHNLPQPSLPEVRVQLRGPGPSGSFMLKQFFVVYGIDQCLRKVTLLMVHREGPGTPGGQLTMSCASQ